MLIFSISVYESGYRRKDKEKHLKPIYLEMHKTWSKELTDHLNSASFCVQSERIWQITGALN